MLWPAWKVKSSGGDFVVAFFKATRGMSKTCFFDPSKWEQKGVQHHDADNSEEIRYFVRKKQNFRFGCLNLNFWVSKQTVHTLSPIKRTVQSYKRQNGFYWVWPSTINVLQGENVKIPNLGSWSFETALQLSLQGQILRDQYIQVKFIRTHKPPDFCNWMDIDATKTRMIGSFSVQLSGHWIPKLPTVCSML